MNPRSTFLSIMGWCPGIKAAARFMPDRDIPPRVIAAYALLTSILVASLYGITYQGLVVIGFPSASSIRFNQISPKLANDGEDLYLVAALEFGNYNSFVQQRSVQLAEANVEGIVSNLNEIIDVGPSFLSTYDVLRTSEGNWYAVYQTYVASYSSMASDLILISSSDGVNWQTVHAKDSLATGQIDDVSLLEAGNGDILLFYSKFVGPADYYDEGLVTYSARYSTVNGWTVPEQTPFRWMGVSSFRNSDGRVCLVGIKWTGLPENSYRSYLSELQDDGSWSEPIDLNYSGSQKVDLMYSEAHDTYYLLGHGNLNDKYVQVCSSRDLKSYSILATYPYARNPSLSELDNGTLILAYEGIHEPPYMGVGSYWSDVNVAASVDGVNWSSPSGVLGFIDIAEVEAVVTGGRSVDATATSIIASLLLVFVVYKKHLISDGFWI